MPRSTAAAGKTVPPALRSLRMFRSSPRFSIRKMTPRLASTLMLASSAIISERSGSRRISAPAAM